MKQPKAFALYPVLVLLGNVIASQTFALKIGSFVNTYVAVAFEYMALGMVVYYTLTCYRRGWINVHALVVLLVLYNMLTILRGYYIADGYWEWRNMMIVTTLALLAPLNIFLGGNPGFVKTALRGFVRIVLPLAVVVALPMTISDKEDQLFARCVTPIYFLVLFLPFFLRRKHQALVLAIALASIFLAILFRSNMARIAAAFAIAALFWFYRHPPKAMLEVLRNILFFLPIVFFVLGATGVFNVLRMNDYISWSSKTQDADFNNKLKADNRTFLYAEVLSSVIKHDKALFGESARGKYETIAFKYAYFKDGADRFSSETGILNLFLYGGIFAVLLNGLIFYFASWYAVCRSRNNLARALGLFITFRWLWMFIEEFTIYDMSYVFLWLMVGLCLSREFREMSDARVKAWINNIFYRKDRYKVI
ncbi:hypothetical protein FACS1894159_11060 [Bacteroidia bacterium]|nr:hypothetical protein FACS1894159_11060 [Bacteroidia bacterium]